MPAAAVASRTPATAGRSGNLSGASGETAGAMEAQSEMVMPDLAAGIDVLTELNGTWTWMAGMCPAPTGSRLPSILLRIGGLVETLDLGLGAQARDQIDLRLAGHKGLELVLDLVELRRLTLALVLD